MDQGWIFAEEEDVTMGKDKERIQGIQTSEMVRTAMMHAPTKTQTQVSSLDTSVLSAMDLTLISDLSGMMGKTSDGRSRSLSQRDIDAILVGGGGIQSKLQEEEVWHNFDPEEDSDMKMVEKSSNDDGSIIHSNINVNLGRGDVPNILGTVWFQMWDLFVRWDGEKYPMIKLGTV